MPLRVWEHRQRRGRRRPTRTVFAVFVLPPGTQDNDIAATKAFDSDFISLGLAAFPVCDFDWISYFFGHISRPLRPRRATMLRGTQRMILSNLLKELLADERRRFVPILDKVSEDLFILSRERYLRTNFAGLLFRRV